MTAPDFSVRDVLAWARTKPADQSYDFLSIRNCAMCQFLRETKRAVEPQVGAYDWRDLVVKGSDYTPFPDKGLEMALPAGTFGALVARLEKLCPDVPPSEWTRLDAYMADIETVSA